MGAALVRIQLPVWLRCAGPWLVRIEDVPPPAGEASLQMFERPALRTQDLVMVALTAFGPGHAQSLAPSNLDTFDTPLTHAEVVEHLHLLWAMRREVAA